MNKKSVVSIVIGLLLTVTNTVVTIATREDWLTSNWLSRSNGYYCRPIGLATYISVGMEK